jgi:hypothetical protein
LQAFSVEDLFRPMRADMVLEAETERAIQVLQEIIDRQEEAERPTFIPVPFIGTPQRLSDVAEVPSEA